MTEKYDSACARAVLVSLKVDRNTFPSTTTIHQADESEMKTCSHTNRMGLMSLVFMNPPAISNYFFSIYSTEYLTSDLSISSHYVTSPHLVLHTPTSSHQDYSIFQSRFSRLISCVCSWVWEGRIAALHRDCSLSFYRCTPSWLAERQVTALVSWTWSILIIPCHIIG